MQQILTLNFFRFVDALVSENGNPSKLKNEIYSALTNLSENELVETLKEIGAQMTNTMEFNFYGAHKIDFNSLLSIQKEILALDPMMEDANFKLKLQDFISALRVGDLAKLNEAQEKIPELFKSYRFIDYLLSQVENTNITERLNQYREDCDLPTWKKAGPSP